MSEVEKAAKTWVYEHTTYQGTHVDKEDAFLAGAAWQRERDIEAVRALGCDQVAGTECPTCLAINAIRFRELTCAASSEEKK